jgi:hypothetical protein
MSWRLKLAVGLMLISVLAWPGMAATQFFPLELKTKSIITLLWLLFGQITWNVGLIFGGVEAVAKRKEIWQTVKNLFNRKPPPQQL